MKYIITGRNKGEKGPDSANPLIYIELGWEVMVNRLRVVNLLQNKTISENDTIVTCSDRLFLYSKIFKNVITNEVFESLNVSQESIINLTIPDEMLAFAKEPIWMPEYKYLHRDLDILLKIDTDIICDYDVSIPFVCLTGRFRAWCTYRNSRIERLNDVISFLHKHKIGIFMMGQDAKDVLKNDIPTYVSLQEACYLMGLPSCKFVYGASCGLLLMSKFCCKSKILVIDRNCYYNNGTLVGNPLFFSSETNLTKVPMMFYKFDLDETEILKHLE